MTTATKKRPTRKPAADTKGRWFTPDPDGNFTDVSFRRSPPFRLPLWGDNCKISFTDATGDRRDNPLALLRAHSMESDWDIAVSVPKGTAPEDVFPGEIVELNSESFELVFRNGTRGTVEKLKNVPISETERLAREMKHARTAAAPARTADGSADGPAKARNAFRDAGDVFDMRFDGTDVGTFKKSVGMRCLHVLLANPGHEYNAAELHKALNPPPLGSKYEGYSDTLENETITKTTRKNVLQANKDLREELKHCTDRDRRDELEDSIEKGVRYLEQNTTGHPKARERGTKTFARGISAANYSKQINRAIKAITMKNKTTGLHLDGNIFRTGNRFEYIGEKNWMK